MNEDKTKEQLVNELEKSGQRVAELERVEADRKRTEEALRESEEEFKLAFENAKDAIFWADPETGLITNCNKAAETLLEKKREEILGHKQTTLHPPQKAKYYTDLFKRHIAQKGAVDDEAEVITKSGEVKPVHITASVTVLKGKPIIQGIFRDMTERKRAKELQNSIYKISEAVHSTQNLEELFRSIHDVISKLMPAKNFYIALYDTIVETITFSYFVDEVDETPKPRKFGRGLTEYVLRTGKSLFATPEILEELVKKREVELLGTTAVDWLGVPLKIKDTIIGVLVVQSYTEGIRFSEKDMDILKFVSTQVAMAIERKRAEEALRKSEERLSAFMDCAPDAFALFDSKLYLVEINNVGLAMFPHGTKKDNIIGKNITEIYPSIKKDRYNSYLEVIKTGKSFYIDDMVPNANFSNAHLTVRAFKVGEGVGIIVTDITERKQVEEKLRTLATKDALTDVLNRGYGLLMFGKHLQLAKRNNSKLSICYVDVDGLKEINDTYGHQEGDEVLKLVSQFAVATLREIDIICRLGGDEFLLVLPQCPIEQALTVWQRIAKEVALFNAEHMKPYIISLSRGFAEFDPGVEKTVDQLIAIADQEMYKDKYSKSTN